MSLLRQEKARDQDLLSLQKKIIISNYNACKFEFRIYESAKKIGPWIQYQ
jgi:hypothetical protein